MSKTPKIIIGKSSYLKGRIGWQGLRASEFTDEGPYLITGTDFSNGRIAWERCYHVTEERFSEAPYIHIKDGDLLITKDGTIGKVAYVDNCPEKAVLNSGIFLLRCKDGSYRHKYAYYVLNSFVFDEFLNANLNGSTINHLYQHIFVRFSFPAIELTKQDKIASILTSIDTAIEKTEALIEKYQQIKAGLMHDLFTRGVLPSGHLRPSREQAPEMYQETAIGWIPREWQYELLDRLAMRGSGHTPNKDHPEYWNGGIKWVSLADSYRLDQLYISDTDLNISHKGIQNSSAVLHPAGIVVLSRDAGVGKSAITTEPMAVSQHFMCWKCDQKMDNHFLYYWLQYNKRTFENIAMGSTILTIGLPYFKKLRIACPINMEEQHAIATKLKSIDMRLFSLQSDLAKKRQQKLGLMQDLLTGKVPVKVDAEVAETVDA